MTLRSLARTPAGPVTAIASAVLFGASTPAAKLLMGHDVDPWMLAGLCYLGSGIGLASFRLLRRVFGRPIVEAPLRGGHLFRLIPVVLFGGVLGPLLLMIGLTQTTAATASLLLNVEGLATMVIAWVVFRENVDGRLLVGAAALLAGAVVLSWQSGPGGIGPGSLAVVGACIAWAIDNNLTRGLSDADPVQIATIKGLFAGATNFGLALAVGATVPSPTSIVAAGAVGFLGYGVSLVLFVLALRHLGSARTGAYFSTAPFIGALLAVVLLGEAPTVRLAIAAVLMGIGLHLHLTERHDHTHDHESLDHDHRHVHDEHHRHDHGPSDPPGEPHTHGHHHGPMTHRHPHHPDLHHRHAHSRRGA